jgi:hypothetical protein
LVFATMADYAGNDRICFTSFGRLKRDCELSERAVIDAIKALAGELKLLEKIVEPEERRGLLRKLGARKIHSQVNIYRIKQPKVSETGAEVKPARKAKTTAPRAEVPIQTPAFEDANLCISRHQTSAPESDEPLMNPPEPPVAREEAREPPEDFQSMEGKEESEAAQPEPPDEPLADPGAIAAALRGLARSLSRGNPPPRGEVMSRSDTLDALAEEKKPKAFYLPPTSPAILAARQALAERAARVAANA